MDSERIEISDTELVAYTYPVTNKFAFPPKLNVQRIDLKDISSVVIARRKYFEEHEQEFKDKGLGDLIEAYRNFRAPVGNINNIVFPIPMGYATRFVPLLFVASKDKSIGGVAITTKPFSKNEIKEAIRELEGRNISVFTEPALRLRPNDPPFLSDRDNRNALIGICGAAISMIVFFCRVNP